MLFIFDWDGTLIDSAHKIVGAMQAAISEQQLPSRSIDDTRNIIGLGLPEAIATLYPELTEADREVLRQGYVTHYLAADHQPCELFPGVLATLQKLKEQEFHLAIATGKSRRGLDRVLAQLDLLDYFDATRCADETRSKPHPQMLHELLDELRMSAEQAVMIGDTEYDLAMARSAGMPRIAVDYGAHAIERLLPYEPALVLTEFAQLLAYRDRFK